MAEMFYGSKPVTPVKRFAFYLQLRCFIREYIYFYRKFAGAASSSCLASPRNSPLSKKLKKVINISTTYVNHACPDHDLDK